MVRVGEVYRVMEGPVAPMDCVSEDPADQTCPLIEGCETRPVWLKMRDAIVESLDSMTLADLVAQHAGRRAKPVAPTGIPVPAPPAAPAAPGSSPTDLVAVHGWRRRRARSPLPLPGADR